MAWLGSGVSTARSRPEDAGVPPDQLNPEVPAALNSLIVSLLSKRPEWRPASALAVSEALRAVEPAPGPVGIDLGVVAPDELALRSSRPNQARSARGWWIPVGVVALFLAAATLTGPPVFERLRDQVFNEGRLVLEPPSSPGAVLVAVRRGGRQQVGILDMRRAAALRLPAGTYDLVLAESADGLKLAIERVTLGRGELKPIRLVQGLPRATVAPRPAPSSIATWPEPPLEGEALGGRRYTHSRRRAR